MDRCAVNNLRKLLFYESLCYNIGCISRAACEAEEELDELLHWTCRNKRLLKDCCYDDWDYKCKCRE